MGLMSEFKTFAMRGNVIDLAVGVIIGGAFGTIVNSLVADVIMPPIGYLIGGVDFSSLAVTMKAATATEPAVVISYGKFIQACVNFLIIAFSIFMVIKAINKFDRKKAPEPAKPAPPTKDQELLSEIRDLLKKQ